jgi:hypothetical protein
MHLWATLKLADEIVAGQVSASEKIAYFVFTQVFFVANGYAAGYTGSVHVSWLYLYEAVVVGVVTYAGARKVVLSYQRPIDGGFFEMTFLLSVPLVVKTTLAMWVGIWGGSWLLSALLPHLSTESEASARAISYWVSRLWQALPFLVAVVVAGVFWYRLAFHVTYVTNRRSA